VKNPPILISVLGFFGAMAGFGWLFLGLRLLGFDWFGALGDMPALEQTGLWGWLAIAGGIAWLLASFGLWSLQPWAWTFAMVVAGFAIFEGLLWSFQYPGSGIGLGMIIMPGIIVLYLLSAEVKAAFGLLERSPSTVA
jgi:hypothetical protein